ncbi:hypothetical protein AXG93_702s1290 [Marchantia polymorpha subsp. ruderalis]|nr:hypothetical protein AXG93_702s1290 [Marchantia polymorpha subsp. ruderalis]
MVGPGGLIHRLAVTRPLVTPSTAAAVAAAATRAGSSRVQESIAGGLRRSAIAGHTTFFGGEAGLRASSMVGIALPDEAGASAGGVRMMGGGPRTFPGGVSKWQWKRMQEKKERQIEKARLLRERQAFEERKRQEVQASTAPRVEKPWEASPPRNPLAPPAAALDPRVTALADRFRKHGAEDLWTEDDGPEQANGAPGRISARFLPVASASAPQHRARPRPVSRAAVHGSTSSDAWDDAFRNAGTSVRDAEISPPAVRMRSGSRRSIEDRPQGQRAGAPGSGLVGKLDNLSLDRKFSSSAAPVVDSVESGQGVNMNRRDRNSSHGGRKPAQRSMGGGGGGPGKRFAEAQQTGWTGNNVSNEVEQQRKKVRPTPTKEAREGEPTPSHLSETRFDQFQISPLSIRALHEVMGYEKMTKVQEATFPVILEGRDVLAKAKTGTGKTIAFLLPSIEAIIKANADRKLTGRCPINVLIICPTRELASQAATEAKTLFSYHKKMDAQIVIGGTNMNTEANNLQKNPCQVLVATPGRLLDHMQTSKEILQQLGHLKVLVLDEADRLLDMGFKKDLDRIIKMLPAARQTLLFSATVPPEVHQVSQVALKKDHAFIDTVGKDDEETHAKVEQSYVIVPLENQLESIFSLLEKHTQEEPDYKVLVFCTTARVTGLMAEISTNFGYNTLEIHSRKSQAFRTRVSDTFRNSTGGVIMFTSDVSARGVDYPDVTLVIQLGCPSGREDYIHRLGRTGRAGKEGQGILVLAPWEKGFLRALKDISIEECTDLKVSNSVKSKVEKALSYTSNDAKEKAYAAWLGYYNSAKMLALSKTELVRLANFYSSTLGLDEPPLLMKKTIGMMGLRGVPGLRS